jgi:hypothetical protein
MNGRRIARYARPQSLSAKRLSAAVILRRRFLHPINDSSGISDGVGDRSYPSRTVWWFRAARMAATIAITTCLRSTKRQYHLRFSFATAEESVPRVMD